MRVLQVVIEAGDVLFLPALWFHYIVSLDVNIQCNTRSGTPITYATDIQKCGFAVYVTEGRVCVCVWVCRYGNAFPAEFT
jgi:hypothetical protein